MKRTLYMLLLLANTTFQFSFGQTQIYNGSFNTKNFQGNVIYNYFDDADGRIFNGTFQFKNSINTVSINGQYKADKKDGKWIFKYSNVASTDLFMTNLIVLNVVGNYQNGNLDGQWNLNRTKTISFNNNGISEYYKSQIDMLSYLFDGKPIDYNKKTIVKEKSTANFKNNHFVGNFTYNINEGNSIVSGAFDSNGYYDSIWTIKYYDRNVLKIEYHYFMNGVLTMIKNKDNSTGDVNVIYDETAQTIEFFQNYDTKENASRIGNKFYKLNPGSLSSERNPFLKDALNIWFNNNELNSYSCAYEIERGSTKMTIYPLLKIVEDYKKTRDYQIEQARIQREIERKKREEEERQRIAEEKKEQERQIKEQEEEERAYREEQKRQIKLEKERQEREKREEEERAYREYEKSDLGQLRKSIKLKYLVWLEKNENETEKEYKARIKRQGQIEFDKVIKTEIEDSKEYSGVPSKLSASLQPYNEDSSHFEIKLYKDVYGRPFLTEYISFDVPKRHELLFSKKYISNRPGYGRPILAYVLETRMINNNWTPSKILFVFNNNSNDDFDFSDLTWYSLFNRLY